MLFFYLVSVIVICIGIGMMECRQYFVESRIGDVSTVVVGPCLDGLGDSICIVVSLRRSGFRSYKPYDMMVSGFHLHCCHMLIGNTCTIVWIGANDIYQSISASICFRSDFVSRAIIYVGANIVQIPSPSSSLVVCEAYHLCCNIISQYIRCRSSQMSLHFVRLD